MPRLYKVRKSDVARAYGDWKNRIQRSQSVKKEVLFQRELETLLNLGGGKGESDSLPKDRRRWFDWKKSDDFVELTLGLCTAIHSLTKVDLTPDGAASSSELTKVVTIVRNDSIPQARLVSNSPKDDGKERYQVDIPRIAFRTSDVMRVTREWVDGIRQRDPLDIGSATFGIRQARIFLSCTGKVISLVDQLDPSKPCGRSSSDGIKLSDDPQEPGSWVAISDDSKQLYGSLYLVGFAEAWDDPNGQMFVTIEADCDAVEVDFQFSGKISAIELKKSQARKHLIEKVLSLSIASQNGRLAFSRARIEKIGTD